MSKLFAVTLAAALALTACKKKEEAGSSAATGSSSAATAAGSAAGSAAAGSATAEPAPSVTCKDAGKNYAAMLSSDPTSILGNTSEGQRSLMKYSYEEACDTGFPEAWTETMKSCVVNAKNSQQARGCFSASALEQLDAMTKSELADMEKNKAANEAAATAGSGSAATGSANPAPN